MNNIRFIGDVVTIDSAVKQKDVDALKKLADEIAALLPKPAKIIHDVKTAPIENGAFFKFSYGLFVLSAKDGNKDNGCIINTAIQLTDNPKLISIAVNKANYTNKMIKDTGLLNISMLTTDAVFDTFKRFGFQSGRDADKFAGFENSVKRSANGLLYVSDAANAFISAKVIASYDYGTHTLFIAEATEAAVLSNVPSLTYQYYFDNVKPKPAPAKEKKVGWVCKICGYVHEGPDLPEDFICPLCKHGASDFERLT
jgi:flavin reductase (DIM6/NTAB) family NADH-FMN oxidoreductase RutF